jgi:hypothetical protein
MRRIISVTEVRKDIHKLLNGEETILLSNHGKIVGILIPFNLEDSLDTIAAKKALKENNFIPWTNQI